MWLITWIHSIIILLFFHPSDVFLNVLAFRYAFRRKVFILFVLHLVQLCLVVENFWVVHYQARYIELLRLRVLGCCWWEFVCVNCFVDLGERRFGVADGWRVVRALSQRLLLRLNHHFPHPFQTFWQLFFICFCGIFVETNRLLPLIQELRALLAAEALELDLAFLGVGVGQDALAFHSLFILLV